ncbi:hypothetical protein DFQ27_009823 [Actinomortierella ambigua]|uniref:Autophagy-related protein 14 n=1 Tax=Actinomortierella ambigua TaxID=1343610 RepID=A0A9P6UA82_9FUNG|nr:hypothetical protein DFQ27_009823 [Actinomortierella ambigua]
MAEPNNAIHCGVCFIQGRTYTCVQCIRSELREHQAKLKQAMTERDELAAQATKLLSPEIRRWQMLLAQREMAVKHAATIEDERKRLQAQADQDRQKLVRLQARISQRKETLKLARARLEVSKISEVPAVEESIQQLRQHWAGVHEKLQHSRHVLVSEVMNLFDLKCVPERRRRPLPPPSSPPLPTLSAPSQPTQPSSSSTSSSLQPQEKNAARPTSSTQRSGSTRLRVRDYLEEDSWNEYLIVGRPLPTGYFENYDRDEINTSIGNVIHMSTLIACYLGVKLPFLTYLRSFVYHIHPSLSASSRRTPLNLSETNLESFAMGLAMLNYNIAYLCYSQGVTISLKKAPNTLENLLACCQSPDLGKYTQYASMMARRQQKLQKQQLQLQRHGSGSGDGERESGLDGSSSPPLEHWDHEHPFDLDLFQLAQILRSRQEESSVWGGLQLHDAIAAMENDVDDYFLEEEDGDEDEDEDDEDEELEEDDEDDEEMEEGDDVREEARRSTAHVHGHGHGRAASSTSSNGIKGSTSALLTTSSVSSSSATTKTTSATKSSSSSTSSSRSSSVRPHRRHGSHSHPSSGRSHHARDSSLPDRTPSSHPHQHDPHQHQHQHHHHQHHQHQHHHHHHHASSSASEPAAATENWTLVAMDTVRIPSAQNYGPGFLGGRGWAAAVPGVVPSALKQIQKMGTAVGNKARETLQG